MCVEGEGSKLNTTVEYRQSGDNINATEAYLEWMQKRCINTMLVEVEENDDLLPLTDQKEWAGGDSNPHIDCCSSRPYPNLAPAIFECKFLANQYMPLSRACAGHSPTKRSHVR